MVFNKRLREDVRCGGITASVRIWLRPKVKAGGRYQMDEGEIEVESIDQITLQDITHQMALESGFPSVDELLQMARHGPGTNVYLVRFRYIPPRPGSLRNGGR